MQTLSDITPLHKIPTTFSWWRSSMVGDCQTVAGSSPAASYHSRVVGPYGLGTQADLRPAFRLTRCKQKSVVY